MCHRLATPEYTEDCTISKTGSSLHGIGIDAEPVFKNLNYGSVLSLNSKIQASA